MPISLTLPFTSSDVNALQLGDMVSISGDLLTGRDQAHKWLYEQICRGSDHRDKEDAHVLDAIQPILQDGLIYHCGPIVSGHETGNYRFISAGPTTSMRQEPYQSAIMRHFKMKGVIGKGGMGEKTLNACKTLPAVYFHAVGGAAALAARAVIEVLNVYKLEFGLPEALWHIRVVDFPAIVTIDAHGNSLHDEIQTRSKSVLESLL